MARCQCGGTGCNCVIVAGDGVEVTGAGSTPNPYVVSAVTNCAEVRGCLSSGAGISFNSATGVIRAAVSADAGNNLVLRPDGLFVPTGAATVTAGCGLTGNGSASSPIRVAAGAWPYDCDPDTEGGVIVCGSDGILRGEPRGAVSYASFGETRTYPDVAVAASATTVDNFSTTVTNPSACRPALVLLAQELDIYTVLPAGAGAGTGFAGDEMFYIRNTGSSAMTGVHSQATKLTSSGTLAPGASMSVGYGAAVDRGSGGAYYYRITALIRTILIAL